MFPPCHLGGYELRCRDVVERIRRRGHEIRVITGRWRANEPGTGRIGVERLLNLQIGPPYPPENLAEMLEVEARDRHLLQRRLREWPPDVIDVWGMEFASQTLVSALLSRPIAVHITLEDVWLQQSYRYDPAAAVRQTADRLAVPIPAPIADLLCLGAGPPDVSAAGISFVSNALARRYEQSGFVHSRSRVRVAGIDLSRFDLATPTEPPPFKILYVGQLTSSRGPEDLIRAASQAAESCTNGSQLTLRFVGAGSDEYMRKLGQIAERNVHPSLHIEFAGPVSPDDIPSVYRDAHLFVQASRLPEGLPTVLMEAMAAGVPIISTDSGGQRDILSDGKWGALISAGDVTAMTAAITDAIQNPVAWQKRAAEARVHALQSFDLERYVDGHLDDLRSATDLPRRATGARPVDPAAVATASGEFCSGLVAAGRTAASSFDASSHPVGAWRLASVLKRCGATADARALFERLAKAGGEVETRRSSFHLAEIALIENRWTDAETHLRRCLETAPDHRKAQYDFEFATRREVPPHLIGLMARR